MDMTVVDNPPAARFEARTADGQVAGFVEYVTSSDGITLVQTEVDDRFKGLGVGSLLARGTLNALRETGATVRVRCPFIHRFLARHADQFAWVQ